MNQKRLFYFVSNSYSRFLKKYYCSTLSLIQDSSSSDFYQLVYKKSKTTSRAYQAIFSALAVLFFALSFIIYFNTTNWACSLYFRHCVFIKAFIYCLCLFFSIFSFPKKNIFLQKKLKNLRMAKGNGKSILSKTLINLDGDELDFFRIFSDI